MNELQHYGVLGMKWGVRRERRLAVKVAKQTQQRKDIRKTKGVATSKYINKSNDLYLTKQKHKTQKAKNEKDTVTRINASNNIKAIKNIKKYGSRFYNRSVIKPIYGHNLTSPEMDALRSVSNRNQRIKDTIRRSLRKVGALAITAGPALVIAAKTGKDFVTSVDPKTIRYDFVEQAFTGMTKRK